MEFTVTLAALREVGACPSGYNKVVRALQELPFTGEDEEAERYFSHQPDGPISLLSILESNGLNDALWALCCAPNCDRDARLFAVWCARQVQHLMKDSRVLNALDVAERFANGQVTAADRAASRSAAWGTAWDAACTTACAAQKEVFIAMCEVRAPWQLK